MGIQWSGLSPELLVRLDRSASQPLRAQLEACLRDAIRTGRLRGGERLPSSRGLARELGVSRGLVQECYSQLLAEGYLTSRTGSATRVADIGGQPGSVVPHGTPGFAAPAGQPPASQPAARQPIALIADFRPGLPDLSSFPRGDWAWAVREACGTVPSADLGYGDPHGSAVLRDVLAGYLARVRAACAEPDRMIIGSGAAQGTNLVLRALARQGGVDCVAFEDPGYGNTRTDETVRAAAAIGLRVVHVPVDEDGLVLSALETSGAQAVVVTPAHQSPTGVVMSSARRHGLLEWTRSNDTYVLEDDYDSEFRYDREPVGVLQGLAPDRVFLLG
jgi:GntR family transcriptional regulator / MocR family aminotransferase